MSGAIGRCECTVNTQAETKIEAIGVKSKGKKCFRPAEPRIILTSLLSSVFTLARAQSNTLGSRSSPSRMTVDRKNNRIPLSSRDQSRVIMPFPRFNFGNYIFIFSFITSYRDRFMESVCKRTTNIFSLDEFHSDSPVYAILINFTNAQATFDGKSETDECTDGLHANLKT